MSNQPPWLRHAALAALLTSTLTSTSACITAADEPAPLDETPQAITGAHTYVGCTQPGEVAALDAAFTYLTSTMSGFTFKECLKRAWMGETHGYLVEDIITRLRAMPTTVTCQDQCDGGDASALGGPWTGSPNSEEMCVRHATTTWPTANLAGVIGHEAAHEQGWDHVPSGQIPYPFSVPEQVNACIRAAVPNGYSRAAPRHDSELPKMGGEAGEIFGLWCPSGTRATGITAQADASAVLGFTLLCGNGISAGHVGGFGGTTVAMTCPTGQSIAGFRGRSGSLVQSLSVGCESDADLTSNLSNEFSSWTLLGGSGSLGTFVERVCPVGKAVIGAVGRSGSYLGSVRWVCGDIDGPAILPPHTITRVGVADTGVVGSLHLCSGYGALTGLVGRAGGEVDQLGGLCAPRAPGLGPNGDVVLEAPSAQTDHLVDTEGGVGGATFQLTCGSAAAVVGVRVRADARITAVGAVCAPTGTWSHGVTTGQVNLPLQGGPGGTYSVVMCPAGEFVDGLETYVRTTPSLAGSPVTVHALSPVCRRLN